MHSYGTDSQERRIVPLWLAAVSFLLAWACSRLLVTLHLTVPWWLDAPSSLAFYGTLYTLFDKHVWRAGIGRKLGLSTIPNLAGRWRGCLVSSHDGLNKRHDVLLHIFQSWTEISVYLTTATSISRSLVAEIQVSDPEGAALLYQYECQPLPTAMKSMHMHYGAAMLRLIEGDCLSGDYYAGRDRNTFGRLCCWREEKDKSARGSVRIPEIDERELPQLKDAQRTASS